MTMPEIPRQLLTKRQRLADTLAELEAKARAAKETLDIIDRAIAILCPGWKAPRGAARKRPVKLNDGPGDAVARGDVARESLRVLKEANGDLTTSAIAGAIAQSRGVAESNAAGRKRVASAVLSALRRFEKKGVVEMRERANDKQDATWGLRR